MSNAKSITTLMRQIRSFSSTSIRNEFVKAPIQLYGLEGRYAHAIYSAAVKQNQLNAVDKDLQALKKLYAEHAGLRELLKNPTLTVEERTHAVKALADPKTTSAITVNALTLVADNGRLGRLYGIIQALDTIMSAHKGDVSATVTSAKALDSASLKELEAVLSTFLQKGKKLKLETKIDSSILGGMVVTIGDRYVDMSISSKVTAYTNLIKETI